MEWKKVSMQSEEAPDGQSGIHAELAQILGQCYRSQRQTLVSADQTTVFQLQHGYVPKPIDHSLTFSPFLLWHFLYVAPKTQAGGCLHLAHERLTSSELTAAPPKASFTLFLNCSSTSSSSLSDSSSSSDDSESD